MDVSNKRLILVLLIISNSAAGMDVPQPEKLVVDILDGEVKVFWKHPLDAPSNYQYNVQMAKYNGEWAMVGSCTGITKTHCDLTSLIHDYGVGYKVKVQLVTGDDRSAWTMEKFLPNKSELQPPSFSLWTTSSTLTVYVHQKPILKKVFPFGPIYTIYLQVKGHDDKNVSAYLNDDMEEDQRTKTFSSLHWGRDYCVSVKVEGSGALSASCVSPKQCLQLPQPEWFIIAVTSLSGLCVLAFATITATFLLCYLRRPEKTPAILKSPTDNWFPLFVGDVTPEIVTDKGWILSSYDTRMSTCAKDTMCHVTVTEGDGEESRRTSLDSGVSMESNSTKNSRESPLRQVDSGHGSLGGAESSAFSQTDFPQQEESTVIDIAKKTVDSGTDLCCRLHSSSMNVNGHASGSLKEAAAVGAYRSQSPSAVHIQVCDDDERFKQRPRESVSAKVVTGYRPGPQWCICSGAGRCSWCLHEEGLYGSGVIKQCSATCVENGLQRDKCDFDPNKGIQFSNYSKQTKMETPFIQLGESLPQLTAPTQLPLVEDEQDFNTDNVPLSLCDVQLTND